MNKYHLTFDVDWAPDFCIEYILDKLKKQKIISTFFVTHNSSINREIKKSGHNLGIHPNFLKGSSHGNKPLNIIENLLKLVPDATSMRSHCLYNSSVLLHEIFREFPQLKLDLTLFTYRFKEIKRIFYNYKDISFERINFNWEDDFAFYDSSFNWEKVNLFGKINVLNFHPIHIYLNSINLESYELLKEKINVDLFKVKKKEIQKYVNNKIGTATFFNKLINSEQISINLSDIS